MTSKLRYPKQTEWHRINSHHLGDGIHYNIIFRGEGKRETKIEKCCEEINEKRRRDIDAIFGPNQRKRARMIIKKHGLNEKFILNLLKI